MQTLIKNGILYTMTEDKGIFQKDIMFFRDLSMHILTSDYLISMWIRV